MTTEDWEPLPPEQVCHHPGELAAPPPAPAAPAQSAPSAPPAPAVDPAPAAPDPSAERALLALKQRLQAQGPARSLIAAAQHREHRQQRRRAAARLPALQATLVQGRAAAPGAAAPPSPTMAAIDEHAADVDPREAEPWFRELPPGEQQRLRAVWWEERHRHDHASIGHRRRLQRAACHGALVLGGLGVLQSLLVGGFHTVLPLAIAGAMAAVVAEAAGGGRFLYAGLGPIAWVVVMGPVVLVNPYAMPGVMLAAYGFGAIGMDGEMRRSAGFVDHQPSAAPSAPVTAPAPAPAAARPAAGPTAAAPAVRR